MNRGHFLHGEHSLVLHTDSNQFEQEGQNRKRLIIFQRAKVEKLVIASTSHTLDNCL